SSRAPQPSVATRARSAATASSGSPIRSRITCQRIDGSESVGFKYRANNRDPLLPDLLIQDYMELCAPDNNVDIEKPKRHKVRVQFENNVDALPQWSVYKCIIFETQYNGHQYILTDGNWYRVNDNFRRRVDEFFKEHLVDMPLPAAQHHEYERNYCERIAASNGFVLFDRHTFQIPGESTGYELCDVLTSERVFLHTKPYRNGSGTLSHLFRQGELAGELFCREPEFRRQAREHLNQ